jgi:transposase
MNNYMALTLQEDRWLNEKWMGRALKRLNLELAKKATTTYKMPLEAHKSFIVRLYNEI